MNPFTNGKLVAENYDSRLYVKQDAKRGDANYVMSRSELMEFSKCPSRWRMGYKENSEGTDSTEWGSLVDCMLFEPERVPERFAVEPDTYSAPESKKKDAPIIQKKWNNNADACKEWKAAQGDKICISRNDIEQAKVAADRLFSNHAICSVLGSASFQVYVTAEYHDEETEIVVPVKFLLDIVPTGRSIDDLKTARDGSPKRWPRTVYERGYHVQAAMFLDGYNAATGDTRDVFRHIVQENFAPFEVSKHVLADEFIQLGRAKYIEALRLYAQCVKTKLWPGYDELSDETMHGWTVAQPEAFMIECKDPSWLSDNQLA